METNARIFSGEYLRRIITDTRRIYEKDLGSELE